MTHETGRPGGPERTDDGRYIVVDGRRWRASDPGIPETLRVELVGELMTARRLVRSDAGSARPRVQDAKVALGERGEPWWEPATAAGRGARMTAAFRSLLQHRATGTVCPSEVSRIVGGTDWRSLSAQVREHAWGLADQGMVVVLQKGQPVRAGARGPIRVAKGRGFDAPRPDDPPTGR